MGRGYATEAAEAALEWCRQQLDPDEVLSLIHPDNTASLRVARRLGFAAHRRLELNGEPVLVHRLPLRITARDTAG